MNKSWVFVNRFLVDSINKSHLRHRLDAVVYIYNTNMQFSVQIYEIKYKQYEGSGRFALGLGY